MAFEVAKTKISGLLKIKIPMFIDGRGDFSELFQMKKLVELGFPTDFVVCQVNRSRNLKKGTARGIHAEPWDKYITTVTGRVFAAIVDLREGPGFGIVEEFEMGPEDSIFVPTGCGNSYQTLEDGTVYSYLVNGYWSAEGKYRYVNMADPKLNINWPIPLARAIISDKDKNNPYV